jgi:hypothetical protein
MTLQQLLQWLQNTQKLPVRSLQHEGYTALYDAQAAPSEAAMQQVVLLGDVAHVCARFPSHLSCRHLRMQLCTPMQQAAPF